jgi:hypothetical protein
MLYRILADATLLLHLLFILFVLLGGLGVLWWRKLDWVHIPTVLWGAGIELVGWPCPLTYLENYLRRKGSGTGYDTSFIEHYLLPVIYPRSLDFEGFPVSGFVVLGVIVLVFNAVVYWWLWKGRGKAK